MQITPNPKTPMKPGQIAPRSGQYGLYAPRGADLGAQRTVTKGEPLPPTPKKGQRYKLDEPIKH